MLAGGRHGRGVTGAPVDNSPSVGRAWGLVDVLGARLTRVLVVALALGCLPVPASAAPEDDLAAAQERANQAAAELAEAQEEIALAQDAVATVQTRVATVEARVDGTRAQVRDLAIRLYVGGSTPMLRILGMADANDVILAQQYSHVVVGASMDALEQYRSDREDLRRELAALEGNRRRTRSRWRPTGPARPTSWRSSTG